MPKEAIRIATTWRPQTCTTTKHRVPKTGPGLRPNSQKLEAVNLHNHGKALARKPLQIMLVHPAAAGNNKSL